MKTRLILLSYISVALLGMDLKISLAQKNTSQGPYQFPTIQMAGKSTAALGVNQHGQIVGTYEATSVSKKGFLKTRKGLVNIDYANGYSTLVTGINQSGRIVGAYIDNWEDYHGFIEENGAFISIESPGSNLNGALSSAAMDINRRGHVVGWFTDSEGMHGFLYDGSVFMDILPEGTTDTDYAACGISERDEIVGWYSDSLGEGFFIHNSSGFNKISPQSIGGYAVEAIAAMDINRRGRVVGYFIDDGGISHGFLYDDGQYTVIDLIGDSPGFVGAALTGINGRGQIVGWATGTDGEMYGFIGKP
jgi:probable HAF family extracellular repeat protein